MTGEEKTDQAIIKGIPYGITDYALIQNEHYYYVDKTSFLPKIEKSGRYLFFIRPRRFGKSLLINVMKAYFDIQYKDRFDEFFKGTWIYDHPTAEKNKYLIFSMNFSMLGSDLKELENSFIEDIRIRGVAFIARYRKYLSTCPNLEYYEKSVKECRTAADVLSRIITICNAAGQPLYIIIDEYDHFTNNLLVDVGQKAYLDLTKGTGFFRAFFNVIKGGTTDLDASISRLFIAGVSPITMDDVTSGFNIGKNISIEPAMNTITGFTKNEVTEMIEYYRSCGLIHHPTGFLLEIMTEWYGNYLFSKFSKELLYNSDMVLYFMDYYLGHRSIPDDLIDDNARIDYGKLRHLILIDQKNQKTTNGNFSKLKEIIAEGSTSAKLVKSFPVEKLLDTDHFKSLLFYFGLLTIKDTEGDQSRMQIPNETARRLYYSYIREAYRETGVFNLDISRYNDLMTGMAYNGQWEPLFDYIFSLMKKSMSLRDLITGEKSVQAFLNVYLSISDLYIVHVERELNKGYADIFMEPFVARYGDMRYCYLLELKYLNAGYTASDPEVLKLITEAETQIQAYAFEDRLRNSLEKTVLVQLVVIFSGHEAVYYKSVRS